MQSVGFMRVALFVPLCVALVASTSACREHSPPFTSRINTFLGTVEKGCTPGLITSVSSLVVDPFQCDLLPLGPERCNLCKMRLYRPVKTKSQFLVQGLYDELMTTTGSHIEATQCRCAEGCYFHESSISTLGEFALPNDVGTVGRFSEAYACYSEISMPGAEPTFVFLIWCENTGGCPNPVAARYNYLLRFELLNANRPATTNAFTAQIVTLPARKCLAKLIGKDGQRFVKGRKKKGKKKNEKKKKKPKASSRPKEGKELKAECGNCTRKGECVSKVCAKGKCVLSKSREDRRRCDEDIEESGRAGRGCAKSEAKKERVTTCLQNCVRSR